MAEWLKAAVLKTVKGESSSRVRIPLPPPSRASTKSFYILLKMRKHRMYLIIGIITLIAIGIFIGVSHRMNKDIKDYYLNPDGSVRTDRNNQPRP
jgi:hypothetical protein